MGNDRGERGKVGGREGKREEKVFRGESESLWEREGRDGIVPFSNYEFR